MDIAQLISVTTTLLTAQFFVVETHLQHVLDCAICTETRYQLSERWKRYFW